MLPAPCTPSVTCLCSRTRATTSASSLPVPAGAWATLAAPGGWREDPPLHAQCNSPQAKAQPCPSQPQAPGPAIPKELAVVLKLVFL